MVWIHLEKLCLKSNMDRFIVCVTATKNTDTEV